MVQIDRHQKKYITEIYMYLMKDKSKEPVSKVGSFALFVDLWIHMWTGFTHDEPSWWFGKCFSASSVDSPYLYWAMCFASGPIQNALSSTGVYPQTYNLIQIIKWVPTVFFICSHRSILEECSPSSSDITQKCAN